MPQPLHYTPLEKIIVSKPADRIRWISRRCSGKQVLDLGAMDETAFAQKRNSGNWLHEEIAKCAKRVVGLDSSSMLPDDGLKTADNACIRRGDIFDLAAFLEREKFTPDTVVAGELIEHIDNPLAFLRLFRSLDILRGAEFVFSTPNATALHNALIGLFGRESTHQDHLCIFSFKTLSTLMRRAGYDDWTITPYHSDFVEMKSRNRGLRGQLVTGGEAAIRAAERAFPLLSFGYIVVTRI
ncbi:class I SAM-dependent methyltransferase [Rhodoblastus acidophilus]|uniref:Class I SAM-dependent methyltransferase n=1 Tax=Candidatus Rhodoblastus alkanivorans TaxID=2954117 RepID=A0ABS9Z992_9HYPH|nr:class I SAM-dependent methyltransferase [Candidatus Rhodoblastus alkanivorans]MCI4678368.1 class I SAM-dependent methyltransferase [Candidatus Rhodoblastus alkanivorans]MCI4683626.1 class I SAM-dependent methyltransferase [Candidatus Rhodoblastus alkanivorans]MDI4640942.1 class I SAM-dependent methyltransferase [Rhodoblastus acidophilus]